MPEKKPRKSREKQGSGATQNELLEQAIDILVIACRCDAISANSMPWDFELGNDFRGPPALADRAAAEALVTRISKIYRDARVREEAAESLTQTLEKFGEIEKQADLLARAVKVLTIDEYRLLHIGAENEEVPENAGLAADYKAIRDLLFPTEWQGLDSKKRSSGLSAHSDLLARYFARVRPALAAKYGFAPNHPDPGGKTKSVHLLVAPSRWRLVHVSWQIFASLPGLSPTGSGESPFHSFLRLIHEAVTAKPGNFSRELTGEAGHYVRVRRAFDQQEKLLTVLGQRYGWTNFQELEDITFTRRRRSAIPLTPKNRTAIQELARRYKQDRALLLFGPDALDEC